MTESEDVVGPEVIPPDWPQPDPPTAAVVGRPADDVADQYRAGGFRVDVVDLDTDWAVTFDLRPNRIRLYHRGGQVESARQG